MALSPRPVATPLCRGTGTWAGALERRPFREDAPPHEDAGRRGTEGDYRHPEQGSLEQPVLRCLCRHDHLDEKQGPELELRLYPLRPVGRVYDGAGYRQDDQLLLPAHME